MDIVRMRWKELGWLAALRELERRSENWRGRWVLLQYTALSWSARGFPLQVPRVLKTLRDAGARIGVVYHDVESYPGTRAIDRLRRFTQRRAFRQALRSSDQAILTVPAEKLSWIMAATKKAVFISVSAYFFHPTSSHDNRDIRQDPTPTGSGFGLSRGIAGDAEPLQ